VTAVRDLTYFKKWYQNNGAKLNERRRERYAKDPEVRTKALQYQAEYRSRVERVSTKGQPRYRQMMGATVQVFRISSAATMIGCSVEFIRKYELRGVIPAASFDNHHRYYNQNQINQMKDFYEAMSLLKFNRDVELKASTLERYKILMESHWDVV